MTGRVLVPDYFEQFHCKCGDCRHPCCDGWGINISEHEYYALIGLQCSSRLRHRLDDAFVVSELPDEDCFATIQPNYLEQCPMLDGDGLCLLQKERGERMLPLICRVYPRAVKKYGARREICMSCSCEATVELLMRSKTALTLHETEIELPFDGLTVYGDESEKERVRHGVIAVMSDADVPIGERIGLIGSVVCGQPVRITGSRAEALDSLLTMLTMLCRVSKSMRECGEPALAFFENAEPAERLTRFCAAEDHLYRVVPDTEALAGRIIANHLLYESFPYTPGTASPDAAFAAFCTAVGLLKIVCAAGMAQSDRLSDFVDLLAAANRFVEHSDFYRACSRLEHPDGMETYARFAPIFVKP